MFEDADGRARQTSTQHQGRVIQLITQNETTLQNHKKKKRFHTFLRLISSYKSQMLLSTVELGVISQATVLVLSNSLKTKFY